MQMKKIFYSGDKMGWDVYRKFLRKISLSKTEKILDAGCGQGILFKYLKNYNLWGIDFSKRSIKLAKSNGCKNVRVGNINRLPYKSNSFDKTICIEVFQYLDNPKKAFKELKRVTKKEVIISVPNYNIIGIRSILFKKWRKPFFDSLINGNYKVTNQEFLRKLDPNVKIKYISCRLGFIRNIFGDLLASEVIGIFKI